jgi:hypothetical protein
MNLLAVFASIIVLVLSVYLSTQNFAERSIAMRNCYIKLRELYQRALRQENNDDIEGLEKIESEYSSLLMNIENHSEFDYLSFRYSVKDKEDTTLEPFSCSDRIRYYWEKAYRGALVVLAFVIPIPLYLFI